MTDTNNAAQAAEQEIDAIMEQAQVFASAWAFLGGPFDNGSGLEQAERERSNLRALLSKLRAEGVQAGEPVTDAQEAFATWWNSQDEGSIQFDLEQYPQDLKATLNNLWNTAWRAGLASAPVAGEAQPVAWRALWTLPTPGVIAWHDTRKVAPPDEAEMRAKGYSLELAFAATQASAEPLARYCPGCGSVGPVGDEYRDCCPDGNEARMIPKRLAEQCRETFRLAIQSLLPDVPANDGGAPQASEAVRILFPTHLRKMWSGGEVQAWLDNHQGITPPTASAKGSLERYRDWRAEQAEADKDGVRSEGHQ
nr:hypothetical protein [uncultured Achromobacter sp.]